MCEKCKEDQYPGLKRKVCPTCKGRHTMRIDTFGYNWTEMWMCHDCDPDGNGMNTF